MVRALKVIFLLTASAASGLLADTTRAEQEKKFFEVTIGIETSYTFDKLSFTGSFFTLTAKPGALVTGKTEKGVTVVIILAEMELKISPAKEEYAAKLQEAFETSPVIISGKQAYLRVDPGTYETMIQGLSLVPAKEESLLKKAKAIYDDKFNGSYHAGPLAMLPPASTFFIDIQSDKLGQVIYEEGDFLKLRRFIPYKSVYPANLVNPKR